MVRDRSFPSLRRHYPDQVLRVTALVAESQPVWAPPGMQNESKGRGLDCQSTQMQHKKRDRSRVFIN